MNNKLLEISEQILQQLLHFKEINPEFTFSLRQRNSVQSKGEKRLEIGQWFQGSDYIYVPLFKRGDNNRKIKTIGFVIKFDNEFISNYIEISFKANNFSEAEMSFHRKLAEFIGLQLNEHNHGVWYFENQIKYINNLDFYLNDFRNHALTLLEELNIKNDYIISEENFQSDLAKIQRIRNNIYQMQSNITKYKNLLNHKKQIILQGPPGTGKTRLANQLAQALIGDQGKDDQIEIVQFHPNFAYEDFVEGLKAEAHGSQVVYKTEDGIFKSFCKKALVSCLNQTNVTSQNTSLETHYVSWLRELEKEKPFCQTKYGSSIIFLEQTDQGLSIRYEFKNNQKLEPATSVYPILKEKLFRLLSEDVNPHTITNIKTDIKPIIGSLAGEYFAVYRHFYDYLKTNNVELQELSDEELNFDEALSLFKEPSNRVELEKQKTYVLIIDEMNRANLSTVLGELISLMEDGKRLGSDESMTVRLPYSKESFAIPNNVYMIGTMNTADRSVSQIDYAIRRRFAFVDVLPTDLTNDTSVKFDAGLFKEVSKLFVGEGNHLSAEFKAHQVQLGHSYFIKKTDNKETMQMRLDYEIKPILHEYVNDGILKQSAVAEIEKLQCSE